LPTPRKYRFGSSSGFHPSLHTLAVAKWWRPQPVPARQCRGTGNYGHLRLGWRGISRAETGYPAFAFADG